MARKLEELPVYPKAKAFCVAVSAIIARPVFSKNRKLQGQIAEANESILSNMAEGFEQSTDAHLAKYLYTAKGSVELGIGIWRFGIWRFGIRDSGLGIPD